MKLERIMTDLTLEDLCDLMCGFPEEEEEDEDDYTEDEEVLSLW